MTITADPSVIGNGDVFSSLGTSFGAGFLHQANLSPLVSLGALALPDLDNPIPPGTPPGNPNVTNPTSPTNPGGTVSPVISPDLPSPTAIVTALGSWVGRIAIIVLGLIFVAVGLALFRPVQNVAVQGAKLAAKAAV